MTREKVKKRLKALEKHQEPPGPSPVCQAATMAEYEHWFNHPEACPSHARLILPPMAESAEAWEQMARDYYDRSRHDQQP